MTAPGPGAEIGPYVLVARIGSGGMGDVWRATGPGGEAVAVKVLPAGALDEPAARRRFAREVDAARRVDHPRVQTLLDADPDGSPPWLATELVDGPTLAQRVASSGPLAAADLHVLAAGLAEALVAVHRAGVVHRDLTPANVVLGPAGPVLVDFGIAVPAGAATVTEAGSTVGTPAWMAPEQLRDEEVTDAADIWAWGAVLAYAANGRPPASGSRPEVVMRRVLDGDLDLGDLPGWLDGLVRRGLHSAPAHRPTADELAADLAPSRDRATWPTEEQAATAPLSASAEPAPRTVPGRRWWRPAVAARSAVLVGGLVLGLAGPPLMVVMVVAVAVVAAMGLRIWAEERGTGRRLAVGPGTLLGGAALGAVAALSGVLGLLGGVIAVVALVVAFLALGGDLG